MTPGLQRLVAFKAAFDFPNEVLSFAAACACGLFYTLMLGARRRLWLTRLRWQRRDALRLASTQLGPVLGCTQGECWESEVEGSGAEGAQSGD